MKKFSYKKGKAVIRTLKEPVIKKKKYNFDRIIYFIIIAIILGWLLRKLYNKTMWINGDGQMLMEKVDVNFTANIKIEDIFIKEGDTVNTNTKLFNFYTRELDGDTSLLLQNSNRKENYENDQKDIDQKIALLRVKLKFLRQKYSIAHAQEQRFMKLVLLDVHTVNEVESATNRRLNLLGEIELVKNEIAVLLAQKNVMDTINKRYGFYGNGGGDFASTYVSPIKGIVGQISKSSKEACYVTENVMTIHNTQKVYVKAYFNLRDLSKIKKGELVHVVFPDKSISQGVINKTYIATYKSPSEFQKKYEPTTRNILAEIIPIKKEDIPNWVKYYKLNLKVRINTF